ncbi:MAG TPA: response regulator [Acidimicrobiales bacterium]|nr:response regulator [Acidimicrobiales bacterium]
MAILVVEDSRAMRMIIRRELRRAGYEDVVDADSGAAALQATAAGAVDLVLSDLHMPDMSGLELLSRLRARGNNVVFGFVTSDTARSVRIRAFETGASFVATKPFTAEELDRHITLAFGEEPPGPSPARSEKRTLGGVLPRLLGRPVSVVPSPAPQRSMTRAVAEYEAGSTRRRVYAVVEMPLAAALACALARIPAGEAQQWARSHAFDDVMEANFFEVANVLGGFASRRGERCVLKTVHVLTEGELLAPMRDCERWHTTMSVSVSGYSSGRLGFVTA